MTTDTTPADAPPAPLAMRSVLIGKAWNDGEAMESLMARHRIKAATVLEHLTAYVAAGNRLGNLEALRVLVSVSPEDQEAVRLAFAELGTLRLKPVFDRLDGRVGYEQLRILRLCSSPAVC